MNEQTSRQVLYATAICLIVLLWTLIYALPRLNSVRSMEKESQGYLRQRQEIANALVALEQNRNNLPDPTPNTVSWLAKNAINGLEKHLDCNNPYGNGLGSQVKLRNLNESEITELLQTICKVNLVMKSFKIDDVDGDGRWNLEMMVEVPK